MDLFAQLMDLVLHLDIHLNDWVIQFGSGIYVILFLIVFCETGLVVLPFLPGDSLLFALGALTAVDQAFLSLPQLMVTMILAALLGDNVNYRIGKLIGPRAFSGESRYLKKKHLLKTHQFYEKHGGKTIVLARFMPIVRTFAPFVAGIGEMKFKNFIGYSILGAVLWVCGFLMLGHYFGNLPSVKRNFHIVIIAIVVISVLPIIVEWLKSKKKSH